MERIHQRLFGAALKPDESAHEELGLSAEEAGWATRWGRSRSSGPPSRSIAPSSIR